MNSTKVPLLEVQFGPVASPLKENLYSAELNSNGNSSRPSPWP